MKAVGSVNQHNSQKGSKQKPIMIDKGIVKFVERTFEVILDEWIVPPPEVPLYRPAELPNGISISGRIDVENKSISGGSSRNIFLPFDLILTDSN